MMKYYKVYSMWFNFIVYILNTMTKYVDYEDIG